LYASGLQRAGLGVDAVVERVARVLGVHEGLAQQNMTNMSDCGHLAELFFIFYFLFFIRVSASRCFFQGSQNASDENHFCIFRASNIRETFEGRHVRLTFSNHIAMT
jgi:hypothetical protein